jgi:hypothetical protein
LSPDEAALEQKLLLADVDILKRVAARRVEYVAAAPES